MGWAGSRAILDLMTDEDVPLSVAGVAIEGEAEIPTVLLRDPEGTSVLAVPVGAFEASAIIIQVEGIQPPRPLTHDVLAELFLRHGFVLDRFELYGKGEEGLLGRLRYRRGFRRFSMEVRPSDGIALALRLDAPISANKDLVASETASNAIDGWRFLDPASVLMLGSKEYSLRT